MCTVGRQKPAWPHHPHAENGCRGPLYTKARDAKVMPNFEVSVIGPYIQLRETSYINVLTKYLCKSNKRIT